MDNLEKVSHAILRGLIDSPEEGCASTFVPGYRFCRIPLILALGTQWSKSKQSETDFVVLTATRHKAAQLKAALLRLQMMQVHQALRGEQDLVRDPETIEIDVQAAAEFLRLNRNPSGKRCVIVVDTLFPDSFTWDHSVHASLQAWTFYRKTWARICLFQPKPESWYGQYDVTKTSSNVRVEEREVVVQDDNKSIDNIVQAIASELNAIAATMPDAQAMLLCDHDWFDILCKALPPDTVQTWQFYELTALDQEQVVQSVQISNHHTCFIVTAGIMSVTCEIERLGAILYTGLQKREVYNVYLRALPVKHSDMSIGELDYCRELLTRHSNGKYTPLLCRFNVQGDVSQPKRQVMVDPMATVFLTTGIRKYCPVQNLCKLIDWLEPYRVSIYVNWLIKLRLLEEKHDPSASTKDIYTGDRTVRLLDGRAQETFRLMIATGRTDLNFCWIEAGLGPPRGKEINEVDIDVTRALSMLIVLLRPRPGAYKIAFDLDNVNPIDERHVHPLLPDHLRTWMDMGAPWLFALLCNIAIKDKTLMAGDGWVQAMPLVRMDKAFLRSVSHHYDQLVWRTSFGGQLFSFGGNLNTSQYVETCYKLIMRQVLDAFSYRLFSIVNLEHGAYAYEFSSRATHHIEVNPLNRCLIEQLVEKHVRPDGTYDPVFGIYFKLTIEDRSTFIDDILIVPLDVVLEWREHTGIEFEKDLYS